MAREVGAYLVLPSGKKIGHRQFTKYWRQNLRPPQIIPGSQNDPAMLSGRLASGYQLMGYKQPGQLTLQQRMEIKIAKKMVRPNRAPIDAVSRYKFRSSRVNNMDT